MSVTRPRGKIHRSLSVCPDVAKFRHFGNDFKSLGNFLDSLFSIWQTFVPTLAFLCYGQIVIVVNGQRLNNKIAIRSHCSPSHDSKGSRIYVVYYVLKSNLIFVAFISAH